MIATKLIGLDFAIQSFYPGKRAVQRKQYQHYHGIHANDKCMSTSDTTLIAYL